MGFDSRHPPQEYGSATRPQSRDANGESVEQLILTGCSGEPVPSSTRSSVAPVVKDEGSVAVLVVDDFDVDDPSGRPETRHSAGHFAWVHVNWVVSVHARTSNHTG